MQKEKLVQYVEDIFQCFAIYAEKTNHTFSELVQIWMDMDEENRLSDHLAAFCYALDEKFSDDSLSREDIRKLFQYILVRRGQDAPADPIQITPDAVCIFLSYLVQKFTEGQPVRSVMDPAVGTANLLTAVLSGFAYPIEEIYGIDASVPILKSAKMNGDLQGYALQLILGDYLQAQVPAVDCMVCELPTGYYPHAETSRAYRMNRTETEAFCHELYIEKMLSEVQAGGWLFLLIPKRLFEDDGRRLLHSYILENAYMQALLELPSDLFQKEADRKRILVLQKKGGAADAPNPVMLAQIPSFQKEEEFEHILFQMNQWFQEKKKREGKK